MGLLARGTPMPFVGSASFVAGPSGDSTNVILAVSLTNAELAFARENDRFRAGYTVGISLRTGATAVRQVEAHESVLVTTFRETSRSDASVIFQQVLTVKPGRYNLTLTVRDDGSSRSATEDVTISVPSLGPGSVGSPIAFAEVAPRTSTEVLPRIVANPTSTVVFGRDTSALLYLESYGPDAGSSVPVTMSVSGDNGYILFSDTTSIPRHGSLYSGVVRIPVSRIGIGPVTAAFWRSGSTDTTTTPIFVTFGEDLPVATYEEMVNYLKWFASPARLAALRDAPPESRAVVWSDFIKSQTTGNSSGNDVLHAYFQRLLLANQRYREEGTMGWLTDRGKVLIALGEPANVYEQRANDPNQRGRGQVWEYPDQHITLQFYDITGFERWRLTNASELEFQAALRRFMK
jgi:GWxTD domain-containing protein